VVRRRDEDKDDAPDIVLLRERGCGLSVRCGGRLRRFQPSQDYHQCHRQIIIIIVVAIIINGLDTVGRRSWGVKKKLRGIHIIVEAHLFALLGNERGTPFSLTAHLNLGCVPFGFLHAFLKPTSLSQSNNH